MLLQPEMIIAAKVATTPKKAGCSGANAQMNAILNTKKIGTRGTSDTRVYSRARGVCGCGV